MIAEATVVIDERGVRFADTEIPVCDVLIDDRRVMSVSPADQAVQDDGVALVPWPPRLLRYLHGVGRFTVREHRSEIVHFDAEVRLDASPGRIQVVDAQGVPLVVDKWGGLSRAFSDSGDVSDQIQMVAALLRDLHSIGINAYLAYGTLLGAVRDGAVIGHDTDTDVAYLSAFSHPADIARESFFIQRELRRLGWTIDRDRLAKLVVKQLHKIDIFVSYFFGDLFCLDQWAEGPLRRDQVLPLSTVMLEGYEMPAPADPDAVLTVNYGPNWRVPDPTFKYDNASPHLLRARAWFGGHTSHKMDWNRYWVNPPPDGEPDPSSFCDWVAERLEPATLIVDVGCGSGADAMELARRGHEVMGFDLAGNAHLRAKRAAMELTPPPVFKRITAADTRAMLAEGTRICGLPGPKSVVARLTLDALPYDGYLNFWLLLRLVTARGGQAFFEFRAEAQPVLPNTKPHLWRRVIDIDEMTRRVTHAGGVITEVENVSADAAGTLADMRRVVARFARPEEPD